jgi:(S)-3,5-dihydroxyphenylglycine transaminase
MAAWASAELDLAILHESLDSPASECMNFLNEVALRFPDAISFAAGRPFEGFFDLDEIHRYLEIYRQHLMNRLDGNEAAVRRTMLQYGRTKGIIHDLITEHLRIDEGISVDPESIVVTVGCQEALYLTLRALRRNDNDAVLAVVPSYVGMHGAAQLVNMPLLPVKESAEGIDLDDLVAVIERAGASGMVPRACYVVPDFANPSGIRLSVEHRQRLLRIAEEHDFLILEDNPYGILGDPSGPPTIKSMDQSQHVVYLGSFAKSGVPGARIGYAIADQRVTGAQGTQTLADQLAKIKSMLTVNTSPIAQAVIGGKLLANGYSLRTANTREIETYRNNLQQILDGLGRRFSSPGMPNVSWNAPTGGFFLLLTVPFVAGDDLLETSAQKHRVLWTPVHHFYPDSRPRNVMRLSFSHLRPHEIEEGLDRLAEFIREHSHH